MHAVGLGHLSKQPLVDGDLLHSMEAGEVICGFLGLPHEPNQDTQQSIAPTIFARISFPGNFENSRELAKNGNRCISATTRS
jgi:hypothetical protein